MNLQTQVTCPLCGNSFEQGEIANHASSCGEPTASNLSSNKRKLDETAEGPLAPIFPNKKVKPAPIFSKSSGSPLSSRVANGSSSMKEVVKPAPLFSKSSKPLANSPDSKVAAVVDNEQVKKPAPVPLGPLADRMRPITLSTYSGQESAVGPKTQLYSILESDPHKLPSLILWGPPGCGKTSLANVIASKTKSLAKFVKMSACVCGVNEVREVIKQAKNELAMFKRKTILFMDEVHRFNKAQQDSFLPHIESGTIKFIGATTENPSFSLNPALLSRCRVVALEKLSKKAVLGILSRALEEECSSVKVSSEALDYLAGEVDGDARSALNNLELVLGSTSSDAEVSVDHMKETLLKSAVKYDKEQHYLLASALQKV